MNNTKFAFVSDFDGTLTAKDFYKLMIEKYYPETGASLLKDWANKEYMDFDFLNMIFSGLDLTEEQLYAEIMEIAFDETAIDTIHAIQEAGGDFIILSAGTSYYINPILKKYNLSNIDVYSNPGVYKDGGIHLVADEASPYYSDFYGINKEKVVKSLQEKYDMILFAGDSAPDIKPCKLADLAFAKGKLQNMLTKQNVPFIPVTDFAEVRSVLVEKGFLTK